VFAELPEAARVALAAAAAAAVGRHAGERARRLAAASARRARATARRRRQAAVARESARAAAAERLVEARAREQAARRVAGQAGRARWIAELDAAVSAGVRVGGRRLNRTTRRLAGRLLYWVDRQTGGDIRPGWERLQADLGLARRTVALHLQLLREAGFLELQAACPECGLAPGSAANWVTCAGCGTQYQAGGRLATLTETLTLRAGGRGRAGSRPIAGMAATYRLVLPTGGGGQDDGAEVSRLRSPAGSADVEAGAGADPVTGLCTPPADPSRRDGPAGWIGGSAARDARATGLTAGGHRQREQGSRSFGRRRRYDAQNLPPPGSPRYARYALAARLQAASPFLRRERTSAVAHAVRDLADAGGGVADALAVLDARPLPTEPDPVAVERQAVRYPARFLGARLAAWFAHAGPGVLPTAERVRAAAAAAADQAARRARRAAERAAAVPAAGSTAAGQLAALYDDLAARADTHRRALARARAETHPTHAATRPSTRPVDGAVQPLMVEPGTVDRPAAVTAAWAALRDRLATGQHADHPPPATRRRGPGPRYGSRPWRRPGASGDEQASPGPAGPG
jgi:hypothetical protein